MMCHTRVILVQKHSVWARRPLCVAMATDKLQAARDHAAVIDLLHHLGTHRSGRAKVSTARKSTAAEVPQKGGQIKVKGYGPTRPKFSNDSEELRVKNRRVEIYIN